MCQLRIISDIRRNCKGVRGFFRAFFRAGNTLRISGGTTGGRPSPLGKVAERQRGRMRSFPPQYAEPAVFPDFPLRLGSAGIPRFLCGWVSCFVNPLDSRKTRGVCACGRGASGGQGLSPPLDLRKGFHPLTRFRWRVPVELREGVTPVPVCSARPGHNRPGYPQCGRSCRPGPRSRPPR